MKKPNFTKDQLNYLAEILRPLCCHVTGMHNPNHFEDNPDATCKWQQSEAWIKAVNELGLEEKMRPAISDSKCGWCARARGAAEEERNLEGLLSLESFIQTSVELTNSSETGEDFENHAYVVYQGQRFSAEYCFRHKICDYGLCSYLRIVPPKFDITKPINEQNYPVKRERIIEAEKEEICTLIRNAGGEIISVWSDYSIAFKNPYLEREKELSKISGA